MPKLDISNFNLACAILGGFTTLFGLVSYVVKHKIYLSEASKWKCTAFVSQHAQ